MLYSFCSGWMSFSYEMIKLGADINQKKHLSGTPVLSRSRLPPIQENSWKLERSQQLIKKYLLVGRTIRTQRRRNNEVPK